MIRHTIVAAILLVISAQALAVPTINEVRVGATSDQTRVVLELSEKVDYHVFTLPDPHRVVIDLPPINMKAKIPSNLGPDIYEMRMGKKSSTVSRVVLETVSNVQVKNFTLPSDKGVRLVVDLIKSEDKAAQDVLVTRPFIVAVDAGHGGRDPGAIGKVYGTLEKDVTLDIAKKLAYEINTTKNRQALLIRQKDETIGLRERTEYARSKGADLFISIHADSFSDSSVEGASVYILSEKGASSEAARWIAESENESTELKGGLSLHSKSDVLASVLLDLSQNSTRAGSAELANHVLEKLKTIVPLHKKNVESAGFVVLKAPDIPSVLIETGFLSSKSGEKRLRSARKQYELAKVIHQAIEDYLKGRALPYVQPESAWVLERRQHIVKRGDTLSQIAEQYGISLKYLKAENHLNSDVIRVGQVLEIPGANS